MKVHVTCPIHRDWVWSSNIEVRLPEVRSWYVKQMWTQLPEIMINTSYVCLLSGYHRTVAAIGWRPNSLVVGSWESSNYHCMYVVWGGHQTVMDNDDLLWWWHNQTSSNWVHIHLTIIITITLPVIKFTSWPD